MGRLGPSRRPARPHLLLRAVRHRWRRGLHVQNGLAEVHMTDIFLLRVKVDRVAEGGRSTYVQYIAPTEMWRMFSISLRSTVAPCGRWVGLGDDLDLTIGFYHPTLPLDRPRTTLPPPPDFIF